MRGPVPSSSSRRTYTTRSGWATRTPRLTVVPNSAERTMRYCEGSNVPPIRVGSGGQGLASLAAPTGDDGAARTGAHPQPEAVHACATPVVRLEGPLALGHGCLSSIHMTAAPPRCFTTRGDTEAVGKLCVSRLDRCVIRRVRVATVSPTFGRLFEGTDQRRLGQTCPFHADRPGLPIESAFTQAGRPQSPCTAGPPTRTFPECSRTVGTPTQNC